MPATNKAAALATTLGDINVYLNDVRKVVQEYDKLVRVRIRVGSAQRNQLHTIFS